MPSPMRHARGAGHGDPHVGLEAACGPSSRRPSRSASRTLPWIGQRAKASRRASSQWMRRAVPGQRVALVPAPLLQPQLGLGGGHRARNRRCTAPCRFTEHRAARVGRGRTVVGTAPCSVPCWPRWRRAPWCPRPSMAATHTVAPGETLWGIAAPTTCRPAPWRPPTACRRGARRRRHEPDDPGARPDADPAGQPGAGLPGTARARGPGGGGYRVAARRHAERDRAPPRRRPRARSRPPTASRLDSWVIPGTTPAPPRRRARDRRDRPPRDQAPARPSRWAPTPCGPATRSPASRPPPRPRRPDGLHERAAPRGPAHRRHA